MLAFHEKLIEAISHEKAKESREIMEALLRSGEETTIGILHSEKREMEEI